MGTGFKLMRRGEKKFCKVLKLWGVANFLNQNAAVCSISVERIDFMNDDLIQLQMAEDYLD